MLDATHNHVKLAVYHPEEWGRCELEPLAQKHGALEWRNAASYDGRRVNPCNADLGVIS